MDPRVQKEMETLKLAAGRSPISLFRGWLKAGRSLDIQDEDGWTPLHTYTDEGDVETVQFLLDHGANPEIMDDEGTTLLHLAAKKKQKDLLLLFVKRGLSLDQQDCDGWTPLHYASHFGREENVQILVDSGAKVEIFDNDGATPFHRALILCQFSVLRIFFTNGVHVDSQDMYGCTALHYACWSDQIETAEFLLKTGSNCNSKDCLIETPLHIAAQQSKGIDVIKLLLKNGADPLARNEVGKTPFHNVARFGDTDSINLFLTSKALDIDVEDSLGHTPLLYATGNKFGNVKLFVEKGAFIDLKDVTFFDTTCILEITKKNTALHVAVKKIDFECVKYLLTNGALVGVRNSNGETAYDSLKLLNIFGTPPRGVDEVRNYYSRHILKVKLLHPVDEVVDNTVTLTAEEIARYQTEISNIKSTRVAEGFSLYEVVTQRDQPDYLFNTELRNHLRTLFRSPEFHTEFPHYGKMLGSQFVRSVRSRYFLSRQVVTCIFSYPGLHSLSQLPDLVWYLIFRLISDHDLFNLYRAVSGE